MDPNKAAGLITAIGNDYRVSGFFFAAVGFRMIPQILWYSGKSKTSPCEMYFDNTAGFVAFLRDWANVLEKYSYNPEKAKE